MTAVVLELIAVLSAALFAGWASYISLIEHPVILSAEPAAGVERFRQMYRRAAPWQASAAFVAALSGLARTYVTGDGVWAAGGIAVGLAIPFTLVVIMPTNRQLLGRPGPRADVARALLSKWGRLHWVRTVLGLAGFLVLLWKYSRGSPS